MRGAHLALTAALASVLTASDVAGQDPERFGLNVRPWSTSSVGFSWAVAQSLVIRPSLGFSWRKTSATSGPMGYPMTVSETWLGGWLDFLFTLARVGRFASYFGVGGAVGHVWTDYGTYAASAPAPGGMSWGGQMLVGARLRVLERLSVFGEFGAEYAGSSARDTHSVRMLTAPLGIVLYFN